VIQDVYGEEVHAHRVDVHPAVEAASLVRGGVEALMRYVLAPPRRTARTASTSGSGRVRDGAEGLHRDPWFQEGEKMA
jgi:hypothetical protein